MSDKITIEKIEEARDKCAIVVAKYGVRYLPIFERLEFELSKGQKQQLLLKKALRISQEISTPNSTPFGTLSGHHKGGQGQ